MINQVRRTSSGNDKTNPYLMVSCRPLRNRLNDLKREDV
jgi:hypothetical protein